METMEGSVGETVYEVSIQASKGKSTGFIAAATSTVTV